MLIGCNGYNLYVSTFKGQPEALSGEKVKRMREGKEAKYRAQ
jgi:hypothetical protein